MTSTVGYGLVLLGLLCSVFAAVVGLWTGFTRQERALVWVQRAVYGFALCMVASNVVMVAALLNHDFSVKYVAQVGSRSTPTIYTIVSLWSSLEGSILFWGAIMGGYLFSFTFLHRKEHSRYMQLSLGMMAVVATFFAFLIAGPANPWTHIPNPLSDGPGPNPLLQNHPLMIIHPPMLYLGFVGMTVPFGIVSGALLRGELGDAWLAPLRRWTVIPWAFLSIGIILGSWWAYAVLGWGGYWAWDPVENASFLPWLTATAFIHSTMVLERKKSLKLWTLALGLASFLLTILGTFMTRSGVFNSVHAFSQSDIGPLFLAFIGVTLAFSIVVLVLRGPMLVAETPLEGLATREGAILVNNLVFVAVTFTVLLGTVFPLVTEAFQQKRISVGEPYFNTMALPGGLLILFLMGVGPAMPWGLSDGKTLRRQFIVPSVAGAVVALLCLAAGYRGFMPLLTFGLAGFASVITLRELLLPAVSRAQEKQESWGLALLRTAARARRRFGGYVVHLGVIFVIVGIAASSAYKVHTSGTLKVGESLSLGDVKIRFDGLESGTEPQRDWVGANITFLMEGGREVPYRAKEAPRMNYYPRSNEPVGSPRVHEGLLRDLYVTLLAFDNKAQTATLNAWIFPLVGWIWYAIPFFVLGSLIALWPQAKEGVKGA